MLTNREIAKKAREIHRRCWAQGVFLHFYLLFVILLILVSARVFTLLYESGTPPFNMIKNYVPKVTQLIFLAGLIAISLLVIYIPALYMLRRYYIGMVQNDRISTTRQYFGANLSGTKLIAMRCAVTMLFLKLFTPQPRYNPSSAKEIVAGSRTRLISASMKGIGATTCSTVTFGIIEP